MKSVQIEMKGLPIGYFSRSMWERISASCESSGAGWDEKHYVLHTFTGVSGCKEKEITSEKSPDDFGILRKSWERGETTFLQLSIAEILENSRIFTGIRVDSALREYETGLRKCIHLRSLTTENILQETLPVVSSVSVETTNNPKFTYQFERPETGFGVSGATP